MTATGINDYVNMRVRNKTPWRQTCPAVQATYFKQMTIRMLVILVMWLRCYRTWSREEFVVKLFTLWKLEDERMGVCEVFISLREFWEGDKIWRIYSEILELGLVLGLVLQCTGRSLVAAKVIVMCSFVWMLYTGLSLLTVRVLTHTHTCPPLDNAVYVSGTNVHNMFCA